MHIYKKISLVTYNSSWWKCIKYRKESALTLAFYRKLGWKLIKKELVSENNTYTDTRTFYSYFLKKKDQAK
jgi:ABC-type antimicrobial peptide transport system ATPase subunit